MSINDIEQREKEYAKFAKIAQLPKEKKAECMKMLKDLVEIHDNFGEDAFFEAINNYKQQLQGRA